VDLEEVLAAFDAQLRRRLEPDPAGMRVETTEHVVRAVSELHGWNAVVWTDLAGMDADAVIAEQCLRFAQIGRGWEWKYYSYDLPEDLPARLLAAGFEPEPVEALLVAELAELDQVVAPPDGIELVAVTDVAGVEQLVAVHDEVFGGDHADVGASVLASLGEQPASMTAVLAIADGKAVSAGRVQLHAGTEFASLWGGGTLPSWRGRGIFRALVSYRAAIAAAAGHRYLQVDASAESAPILGRLGFHQLATTTPFQFPALVMAPNPAQLPARSAEGEGR
jgi:GNAT superfamily N-acetyltransferase